MMNSTIYVTRNGLLEPLGQSQVLPYLRGLAQDHKITLITYEKEDDLANTAAFAAARSECDVLGIRWLPQRFRSSPKIIAPALSMIRMAWLVWRESREQGARLIHARSYIPAAVALTVGWAAGVPFIFDMRALWPEELVTAGRLRPRSLLHRVIVWAECACLRHAAGVVSLTSAAVDYLREKYPTEMARQRVSVIPTCADLERFTPQAECAAKRRVHGCVGTILSGWFLIDWLRSWVAAAARRDPNLRFEIITRDDPAQVRNAVDPSGDLASSLVISSRSPDQMPAAIRDHALSVMFFTEGLSKLGSSPTRMGEALAAGLPIVANAGVGDVAKIIARYNVGVIVEGPAREQMDEALEQLERLMEDPELPVRCRRAAEDVFSLKAGTNAYAALYKSILE